MPFKDYIFRSHMVGKIINVPKPLSKTSQKLLTDYTLRFNGTGKPLSPKQKDDLIDVQYKEIQSRVYKLTEGQKLLLSQLAFAETHSRKAILNSEKLTKGITVEKESRDILSRVTGLFLTASVERKTNKWVTGEIDVEPNDVIPDIKSAWSWESFSKILQDKPNEVYLRQGDSYMDLWNKKEFLLCHILTDTPFNLVDGIIKKESWNSDLLNIEGDVREDRINDAKDIISNHIFSRKALEGYCHQSPVIHIEWFDDFKEIPEESRVHMIPHKFDKERIEQRNKCISIAREYMGTVKPINNFNKDLLR